MGPKQASTVHPDSWKCYSSIVGNINESAIDAEDISPVTDSFASNV